MRPGASPRVSGDRGQAAVELALALPVVALALLAVLQVVLVGRDEILVVHAAREGARAAALGADPIHDGQAAARAAAASLVQGRLRVEVALGPDTVSVTVRYASPTDVALVGPLVGDAALHATVVMRREP